ncbi:acyltransferase family protein [Novosphingobium terrae]|uniref:acyltransferase family protein n=1 Tax=Novosphingobium terrae TaxID=2726189 RepID=UPI00197E253F|nr:acyltransferase [Novosphingobium terrae]
MTTALHNLKSSLRTSIRGLQRVILHGAYRPEVDGLRFLAIAFVILGHLMEHVVLEVGRSRALTSTEIFAARLLPAAQTGVLLFFAISGYILAAQFKRRWQRNERLDYGTYFKRRIFRIAPPYLLVLIAGNLAIQVVPSLGKAGNDQAASHFVASVFYVHGLIFGALPRGFPPGWSLELEVQFYLIAPFLFFAYFRLRPPGRNILAGFLTTIGLTAWIFLGQYFFGEMSRYYFTLPKFISFFWIGFWLADLHPNPVENMPKSFTLLDVIGFLSLSLLALLGTITHFISHWNVVALVEFSRMVMIFLTFFAAIRGQFFRRMLSSPTIAFLGSACYSFYLIHLPLVQIMTMKLVPFFKGQSMGEIYGILLLVETPVILVVGLIFYTLIERPFQKGISLTMMRGRQLRKHASETGSQV